MSSPDDPGRKSLRHSAIIVPLRGVGQILFQDNALTGVFCLAGIAVHSPLMAAGCALGALIGTGTARSLRIHPAEIESGLYGFNAGLSGLVLLAFYPPTVPVLLLSIVLATISSPLTHFLRRQLPVPPYTTSFVVTTWLALFVCERAGLVPLPSPAIPEAPAALRTPAAVITGISAVLFQPTVLSGILFLAGILLSSWRSAAWATVGSLLGLLTGRLLQAPESSLALGQLGYNAVLSALALARIRPSVLLPVLGALLSTLMAHQFPRLGLATLTAPLLLANWTLLALDRFVGIPPRRRHAS